MDAYKKEYKQKCAKAFYHIRDYAAPLNYALIAHTKYTLRNILYKEFCKVGVTDFNIVELVCKFMGPEKTPGILHPKIDVLKNCYGAKVVANVMREALEGFIDERLMN
jgi:hypothetical protein